MQRVQEPTTWQKMKIGALTGAGVGLTIGFLFGSYSILRGGAGPRGLLPTLSQYMLSSAATFGFFLSIGSVIRNDSPPLTHAQAARLLHPNQSSLVQSRAAGFAHLRARWDEEKRL